MNAYMIVGPTNRKPRFARSFDSASACAVRAGTVGERSMTIHDRLAADERPDVAIEAAALALECEKRAGIGHRAFDLQPIAHDALVRHQPFDLAGVEAGDARRDRNPQTPRDNRRAC